MQDYTVCIYTPHRAFCLRLPQLKPHTAPGGTQVSPRQSAGFRSSRHLLRAAPAGRAWGNAGRGEGAMTIADKPHFPACPRPSPPRGCAASGGARPVGRHRPVQAPPRAGGDGWSGTGRGRGRRGEMSRSLRETGENRKPAGRGGAALASPSPLPASPRRVAAAAAAVAAAPWGVSSPAAGSRPWAASSSKREPGRTRRPPSRRRRSTAGTCEPRYRPGCCRGLGLGLGGIASLGGHRLALSCCSAFATGRVLRQGSTPSRSRCYGSVRAVHCVYLNN